MLNRILVYSLSLLATTAFATGNGNEGGGGGGGFVRSGTYVTFGTAGFQINPTPLTNIPGLSLITGVIKNDLLLSNQEQAYLLQKILPMGGRKYFDVPNIDPSVYKELQKKYAAITGQPESSIVIFAVTDTRNKGNLHPANFLQAQYHRTGCYCVSRVILAACRMGSELSTGREC